MIRSCDGATRIVMKVRDDDNVVWVGHKCGSRREAEGLAAMIESRASRRFRAIRV